MDYQEFIKSKKTKALAAGFSADGYWMPPELKDFQEAIVKWAVMKGRCAIFADTGLGKTLMQLSWAHIIQDHTDKPVLILSPLCVAQQTVAEGKKFGIDADYIREPKFTNSRIHVTNYEMLKNFDPENYAGIVVDESSILKGLNGKVRKQITEFAQKIQFRLSCTATPSPNDTMELGTQSEFLGVMSQTEMLAMFFIHDGSDTSKWRLKGHGASKFWEWIASWAVVIKKPSDLGFCDDGYDLPPLNIRELVVETECDEGQLFAVPAAGLMDRNRARRDSIQQRCEAAAGVLGAVDGPTIAWCNLNDESETVSRITGSAEITGSMSPERKAELMTGFADGLVRSITTKPKIAGFGLNWQHCNNMVFVGLSDSFESFYQAVRRCWRFGQTKPVNATIIISDKEGAVLDNIKRKQADNDLMTSELVKITKKYVLDDIRGYSAPSKNYIPTEEFKLPGRVK